MKQKVWTKILCYFESICTSIFLFLKHRIKNKQLLGCTYTSKYSQSDINNQVPLTPHLRLWNRLFWLVAEVLNFINKWNQLITRAQCPLHKFPQIKLQNNFFISIISICFLVGKYMVITDLLENCYTKNSWLRTIVIDIWKMILYWNNLVKTRTTKSMIMVFDLLYAIFLGADVKHPNNGRTIHWYHQLFQKFQTNQFAFTHLFVGLVFTSLSILISYFSSVEISCRDRSQNNQIMNLMTLNDKNFKYK